MAIDFMELNYFAILAGGILYMAFGALYFSPLLFGEKWTRLNNLKFGKQNNNTSYIIGSIFVAFISSFLIALIVQVTGADSLLSGLMIGMLIGILAALAYLKNTLFGMTSIKIFAIAITDHIISFTLLSILHAMWRY